MIDTHTHLYSDEFSADRHEMVQRAINIGVTQLFLPNINSDTIQSMEQMTKDFPGICYAMMGLHPSEVRANWEEQLNEIKKHYLRGHHIGIGEIGIDLYWDTTFKNEQLLAFQAQVQWAKEEKLPVSIHCRNSFDEILSILDLENDENLSGVLHCFTGSVEQANRIIDYGNFKLGIGGIVTFKNGGLAEVLEKIDIQHIVLETDSPYLAPSPMRGKRNESSFLQYIVEKLSSIYKLSPDEIISKTTQNALEIFNIKR